jgi:hypothetical protein
MLMNLCVVLFTAQLLFITAKGSISDKVICAFLAMVKHYFWLATFFWMNAIAANMAWTFSRGLLDVTSHSRRRLKLASCYAYGIPGLIVLVCGLLDKLSDVPIGYGNGQDPRGPCWFTQRAGLIYGFFFPVGLMIASNICLFIITTVSISKVKQMSKVATRKDGKTDFVMFVKLPLLMGFAWIFGFIGTFTDNTIIWHLFVLLNSALGLYISLAFFFNRRTLKLLQTALGKGKVAQRTTKTTSDSGLQSGKVRDGFDAI